MQLGQGDGIQLWPGGVHPRWCLGSRTGDGSRGGFSAPSPELLLLLEVSSHVLPGHAPGAGAIPSPGLGTWGHLSWHKVTVFMCLSPALYEYNQESGRGSWLS